MACCGKKNKDAPVNISLNEKPTNLRLDPPPDLNTNFPKEAKVVYVKSDSKTDEFVRARSAICSMCINNPNGFCIKQRDKETGKQALVEDFVLDKDNQCPDKIWGKIELQETVKKRVCNQCGRKHQYFADICKVCVTELERKRRNLERGIGSKSHLIRFKSASEDLSNEIDYSIKQDPFTKNPLKHLHYFIYPKYEESTEHHLHHLESCIDQFNGKTICCIAIEDNTFQDKYMDRFKNLFSEIYMVRNDSSKRERVGFVNSLQKIISDDPNEVICFAHGKGQQFHTKSSTIIRQWTDAMYETCVKNWEQVKIKMEEGYPAVGSFKSVGQFRNTSFAWHYSGSFWWARSYRLNQRRWRGVCKRWWASESYVGRHFTREEGACVFGEITGSSLYDHKTWEYVNSELEKWRKNK